MENVENSKNRIYFFDNIRSLIILFVAVYHAAFAYSSYSLYWPVADKTVKPFDFLIRNLDIFMMPTLFFISGFFALSSLNRRGKSSFIVSKLRRLGIPLLFGMVLFVPIKRFIYVFSRGNTTAIPWELFVQNIKDIISFHSGYIKSPLQFDLVHFWFISLLLFYFCVFFVFFVI